MRFEVYVGDSLKGVLEAASEKAARKAARHAGWVEWGAMAELDVVSLDGEPKGTVTRCKKALSTTQRQRQRKVQP